MEGVVVGTLPAIRWPSIRTKDMPAGGIARQNGVHPGSQSELRVT
jgi:hypothetical protein